MNNALPASNSDFYWYTDICVASKRVALGLLESDITERNVNTIYPNITLYGNEWK